MIPAALIQGDQKRKAAKAPKRKVYTVDVEIDGKRYEFDLEADSQPTEADVMGVANQYAGQVRKGVKSFAGAKAGAVTEPIPMERPAKAQPKAQPKSWVQNATEAVGKKLVDTGVIKSAPAPTGKFEYNAPNPEQVLAFANQYARQGGKPWSDNNLVPYTVNVGGQQIIRYMTPEDAAKVKAYAERRTPNVVSREGALQTIANANRMTDELKEGMTDNPVTNFIADVEKLIPGSNLISKKLGDKGLTGHLAGMASAVMTAPIEAVADAYASVAPDMTIEERLRAVFNVLANTGAIEAGAGALGSAAVKGIKNARRGASVLDEVLAPPKFKPKELPGYDAGESLDLLGMAKSREMAEPGVEFRPATPGREKLNDAQRSAMDEVGATGGVSGMEAELRRLVAERQAKGEPVPESVYEQFPDLRPKPRAVEQMPPPVAMESPIKGEIGEAVPRARAGKAQLVEEFLTESVRPSYVQWTDEARASESARLDRVFKLGQEIQDQTTAEEALAALKIPKAKRTRLQQLEADGGGATTAMLPATRGFEKERIGASLVDGEEWWTNTHVAFKGSAPLAPTISPPDISRVIPYKGDTQKGAFIGSHVAQGTDGKPVIRYVFESQDGTVAAAIDSRYIALARKTFGNDVEFWIQNGKPALVVKDGDTVGVIMPMALEGADTAIRRMANASTEVFADAAPTTSRYGPSYGTPQPGQGQRVGYPMRSVLDEVLGTPKVDANRAKEPWEMSRDELERLPSEDLDMLAFGVVSGEATDIPTSRIIKKYKADYDEAKRELEKQPNKDEWAAQVLSDSPPVEVRLRNGNYEMEDGYHRLVAAERLGVDLQAVVDIEDNPIEAILAKYGNDPSTAPVRPVETPLPTGATPEPTPQTVTPTGTTPETRQLPDSQSVGVSTTPTSARQADINADMEALGKAGFSTDEVRTWGELAQKADPNDVPMEAGAWTDQQTVNATVRMHSLKAKYDALNARAKDGDLDAANEAADIADELQELARKRYEAGTEQGRALASRKFDADLDMSAPVMKARLVRAYERAGANPTPKQLVEVDRMAAEYEAALAKIKELEAERAQRAIETEIKQEKASPSTRQRRQTLDDEMDGLLDEFKKTRDAAPAGMGSKRRGAARPVLNPELVPIVGKMVANRIKAGVLTIEEIVEAIQKKFAERLLDPPTRQDIIDAYAEYKAQHKEEPTKQVAEARRQRAELQKQMREESSQRKAYYAEQAERKAASTADKAKANAEKAARAAERAKTAEAKRKAQDVKNQADAILREAEAEYKRLQDARAKTDAANRRRAKRLEDLDKRIAEYEAAISAEAKVKPKPRKPQTDPRIVEAQAKLKETRARYDAMLSEADKLFAERFTSGITGLKLINPPSRIKDLLANGLVIADQFGLTGAAQQLFSGGAYRSPLLNPSKTRRVIDRAKRDPIWRQWLAEGKFDSRGIGGKMAVITDIPAKMFVYHSTLDDLARLEWQKFGRNVKDGGFAEFVERFAMDPPEDAAAIAMSEAIMDTFNATTIIKRGSDSMLAGYRRFAKQGTTQKVAAETAALVQLNMTRFANTLLNVAKDRASRAIPFAGEATGLARYGLEKRRGTFGVQEQREISRLIAKGAVGTAGFAAGYYGLYKMFSEGGAVVQDADGGSPYWKWESEVLATLEELGGAGAPVMLGAAFRTIDDAPTRPKGSRRDENPGLSEKEKSAIKKSMAVAVLTNTPLSTQIKNIAGILSGRDGQMESAMGKTAASWFSLAPLQIIAERYDAAVNNDGPLGVFGKAPQRDTSPSGAGTLAKLGAPIAKNIPIARQQLPERKEKVIYKP